MNKISITERRNQIVQMVKANGYISAKTIANHFGVSTETIRKDLLELDKQNILKKGHGEATLSSTYLENSFDTKSCTNLSQKTNIAEYAMKEIPEGGIIFIDSGSTCMQLAKLLHQKEGLTIITNSFSAAQVLIGSKNQLLLTGGELREKSLSLVASWTVSNLSTVMADVAFIGCDGFHEKGPSIRSYRELEVKQLMLSHAAKSILLCDSTKFNERGLYCFADFVDFSCMITDSEISDIQKKIYLSKINTIIV